MQPATILVSNIEEIELFLEKSKKKNEHIDLSKVSEIDIAGVQLILKGIPVSNPSKNVLQTFEKLNLEIPE
jgi:hypothetical protein